MSETKTCQLCQRERPIEMFMKENSPKLLKRCSDCRAYAKINYRLHHKPREGRQKNQCVYCRQKMQSNAELSEDGYCAGCLEKIKRDLEQARHNAPIIKATERPFQPIEYRVLFGRNRKRYLAD